MSSVYHVTYLAGRTCQEHGRKCRVGDIASRCEEAAAGPVAAHEKNRQLIDRNRQLMGAELVDLQHPGASHGVSVMSGRLRRILQEKGASMLQGRPTPIQGVRPVPDVAASAHESRDDDVGVIVYRTVGKLRARIAEEEVRRA